MKRNNASTVLVRLPPAPRRQAVAAGAAAAPHPAIEEGAVDALRRHLASGTAREHVVLDFLEDDLSEARSALSGLAAWLANVERSLSEEAPTQQQILSLALGGSPQGQIDQLSSAFSSLRRRLAQVAARM